MKKKRKIRSITAITIWSSVFVFILWAGSMFCTTIAVAQNFYDLLMEQSEEFVDYVSMSGQLDSLYDDEHTYEYKKTVPGVVDDHMLDAIKYTNSMSLLRSGWQNDSINVLRDVSIPFQTAVAFYDSDGNVLHESGDFVYFQYVNEDVWKAESEEREISGFAYIDLGEGESENDPYALLRGRYRGTRSLYDIRVMKITGFLQGAEIKPVKMSYVYDTLIYQALEKTEPEVHEIYEDGTEYISYNYTVSGLDKNGLFEWRTMFDNTAESGSENELITIYALYPKINIYDAGGSVEFQGAEYESLRELLSILSHQEYGPDGYGINNLMKNGLNEIIVFGIRNYRDLTNYSHAPEDPLPEPDFIMLTAISSRPLDSAISDLRYVYIATFIIAALVVLILRKIISRNLTKPVEAVNDGISAGWGLLSYSDAEKCKWREANEIYKHYDSTKDKLRLDKNEITRLNTALDYVKRAEQNRRQMTSSIAHELKTPLAVIHSYSEGLKEHIAEEKRERYLDIILEESEHMDAMVLEMLDLSRLEAGKVKLSRDVFSLTELVKSVFDKLDMVSKEKNLQISFEFKGECVITADEARITQVVANFAANAVKYSPSGGNIFVKTYSDRNSTVFSVENESEHFSTEELSRVWETFYRTDNARTGEGTGLGLAIAKSIIDLHGGNCYVRNTEKGVEFGFKMKNQF